MAGIFADGISRMSAVGFTTTWASGKSAGAVTDTSAGFEGNALDVLMPSARRQGTGAAASTRSTGATGRHSFRLEVERGGRRFNKAGVDGSQLPAARGFERPIAQQIDHARQAARPAPDGLHWRPR